MTKFTDEQQERLDTLRDLGYDLREEIEITYYIKDPDGRRVYGTESDDEDEAWEQLLDELDAETEAEARAKLKRWNAAVQTFNGGAK